MASDSRTDIANAMSKLSQMLKPATKSIKTQDPVNFLTQLSKLILGGSGFEWPGIRISSPGILKTENNELFNHNGPIGTVGTTGNPAGDTTTKTPGRKPTSSATNTSPPINTSLESVFDFLFDNNDSSATLGMSRDIKTAESNIL